MQIARDTRIKRDLLEAFERNDLSEWPRGLYARAWMRAYATAVGLDAIDTVDEFCRLFPHGDRRMQSTDAGNGRNRRAPVRVSRRVRRTDVDRRGGDACGVDGAAAST